MIFIIELIGWIGMALIVSAFFLVAHGKIDPKSRHYQVMNIAGSIGIGIDVYTDQSWPALTLQIVWILIAFSAILSVKKEK